MSFGKMYQLINTAIEAKGNSFTKLVEICKRECLPVPEDALRRLFENEHVNCDDVKKDRQTKVASHAILKATVDLNGLTWYRYIGSPAAVQLCKSAAIKMGVPKDRVSVFFDDMLCICFLHPSVSPQSSAKVSRSNSSKEELTPEY